MQLRGRIAQLEKQDRSIRKRNHLFVGVLAASVVLLLTVSWIIYDRSVVAYAVLDNIEITQDPVSQGKLHISFSVVSPGKVLYARHSGIIRTQLVDYFHKPGPMKRTWSWMYTPGSAIVADLRFRRGLRRSSKREKFGTADSADIVVLMDSTGSMLPFIRVLEQQCVAFSNQLQRHQLKHRFHLFGFGDRSEDSWLKEYQTTDDASEFQSHVADLAEPANRFDGGDPPESSLDALERALAGFADENALRVIYLVTDAQFHSPTASGLTVSDLRQRLSKAHILLHIFSRPEFESDYRPLLSDNDRFSPMQQFGQVLRDGRILED